MNFKARYQAMKNRQGNDWWTITFGDPISWIVLGVIGDVKWITPIGITWLSFLCKISPSILMLYSDSNPVSYTHLTLPTTPYV